MVKRLNITVEEDVYQGLHEVIGRGHISSFIEGLVRPHVLKQDLTAGYLAMAQDEEREREALEWSENLIGDSFHETR
jgi:predicted CopG family antitoxin